MKERLSAIFAKTKPEERELFERAAQIIRSGGLVGMPTETVYGLAANALDAEAVKKIYLAKGRPSDNPLILHVCDIEMAALCVELNQRAESLMELFWPGPLSLVLNAKPVVPARTRGGLSTAAIRMPNNRIALELIKASGVPIAAPSANISGRPSPTDSKTVKDDLGDNVDMVLDGGPTYVGVESTVLDVTGEDAVLLRPGGISKEQLEDALNAEVKLPQDGNIIKRSPGTRYRHYAPKIPLVLSEPCDAEKAAGGKRWIWIGVSEPAAVPYKKVLFSSQDEYARELFRVLRLAENSGAELIVAETPNERGIGRALMDRLVRASGI